MPGPYTNVPTQPAPQQAPAPQPTQQSAAPSIDPQALALSRAIELQEGGGKPAYNVPGASGEQGAGQWMPGEFAADAKAAGLDPNDFSPQNQDKVVYATVKAKKDAGMMPAEIASEWNSGSPDNYTNHSGINSKGVAYNTPAYVKGVQKYYTQLIASSGQQGQQYNAVQGGGNVQLNPADLPSPQQPGTTSVQPSLPPLNGYPAPQQPAQPQGQAAAPSGDPGFLNDVTSGNIGGALEDAGNFIAPAVADTYHDIKGDSTKTGLQQAGDWGSTLLSALALVPGLEPEALAAKAGLVGEEGLGVAGRIAANSALGAGFGATNALGSGVTDPGQIAQSGLMGGAVGGGLGAAGEALGGVIGKYASNTTESRLLDQANRLKTLQRSLTENSRPGTTPITTLLSTAGEDGKPLSSLLKVTDGKVDASGITNPEGSGALDNLIENHSADATKLVQSMKGGVPVAEFKTAAEDAIKADPTMRGTLSVPKALATLDSKIQSAQMSYGNVLPYTAIDEIRAGMNKVYDPNERDVARIIGDTSRKILYNGNGTNDALKATMANESELIRAKNFAEKLHGTTVKGGRLGKYAARALGGAVGTAVGQFGGPLGEGAGALAGGYLGNMTEDALQRSYFNPIQGSVGRLLQGKAATTAAKLANVAALRSVK